jgi:MFS family permease
VWCAVRRRIRQLVPPPGVQRGYALATLIDATGTGLFLTASAVFFVRIVGLSPGQVGLGMSLAGVVGLVSAAPAGYLGDRFGHRRVLIILSIVRAPLFAAYLVIHDFSAFLVVVSLITAAEIGSSPVRRSYLSTMVPPGERVRITAYNRAAFNAGISLGSLGAGVVLGFDSWTAYAVVILANAVSYVVCVAVLMRLPAVSTTLPKMVVHKGAGQRLNVLKDRPFIVLSLLFGLLYVHAAVLTIGIPLWVVSHTTAPRWIIAVVMFLNTVLVITMQVRMTRGTDTAMGAARAARRAGLVILLGCLVCALSAHGFALVAAGELAIGAVVLTVGELMVSAGAWGLSNELAPEGEQGLYFGVWSQGTQFAQVIGPVVVVTLVVGLGVVGWLILGASFAIVGFVTVPVTRWAVRGRRVAAGPTAAMYRQDAQ